MSGRGVKGDGRRDVWARVEVSVGRDGGCAVNMRVCVVRMRVCVCVCEGIRGSLSGGD